MKFTKRDVDAALLQMAMLRFWPTDEATRGFIGKLLAKMVPSLEALRWLTETMCNEVGEWQGPRELRAVLCRKYTPADGVRVGGPVTPSRQQVEAEVGAAIERYRDRCNAEYEANLAQWKAEAARQLPGECEPLPPVLRKPMPKPRVKVLPISGASTAELEAQLERELANGRLSDEERERRVAELRAAVARRTA